MSATAKVVGGAALVVAGVVLSGPTGGASLALVGIGRGAVVTRLVRRPA